MKPFYISKLFILLAILLGWTVSVNAQTTTFSYTGSVQTYIVPSGVSYIAVDASGAKGGASYSTYGIGGCGGRVQAVMAVTPGQTYYIYVGGAGVQGTCCSAGAKTGGYNGGGNSGSQYYGGSGGGATDMRLGGTATNNRVLVAGGGGGGGYPYCSSGNDGGDGGGVVGAGGKLCGSTTYCPYYNATGGTQSAGGIGGTGGYGATGSQTAGGAGYNYGGGGGGGYWGGGGGGYYSGGGGGSSYPASFGGAFTSVAHTAGYNCSGNGTISITPDPGPPAGTSAFSYTGSIQTYTVPSGVSYLTVDMAGAAGGDAYSTYGAGGCGGRVKCVLAVTAGQVYYIYTGGKGTDGNTSSSVKAGGFNGGGSTASYPYGAGGGGATDIRFGGTAISNRILVAGGGGGGGYNCSSGMYGGAGGGLTGESGYSCGSTTYSTSYNPTGGTQSGGGSNGASQGGTASTQGSGSNTIYYGGAGGGGYWGGGAGYWAAGAGGSSYPATASGNISGLLHTQGYNCSSNGYCVLTPAPSASSMTTFSYTGAIQTYTVPTGITLVAVDAYGAKGGSSYNNYGKGGCGGYMGCTLAVTPGQILYVYAGGVGTSGNSSGGSKAGGWNGGGASGSSNYGAGGGGASDIRTGGTALANRIVVAGGGGGGGSQYCNQENGGAGGGLTGLNGQLCNSGTYCLYYNATGGTQSAGGIGGTGGYGATGTQTVGGTGYAYAGGGGGGYWGGGGGGYYSGGGGGSSYANGGVASNVTTTSGLNCAGAGVVYITPICTAGTIVGPASACTGFTAALTDLTTGGSWTTPNTTVATVNSATGVVTGVSAGTATISYGGVLSCGTVYTTKVITIVAAPSGVTGSNICQALNNTFTVTGSAGAWSTSNTTIATINSATGVATGVGSGSVNISYSLSSTCYTYNTFIVNPTAPVTGPTTVCEGLTITLSDAITGGTWTSSSTSNATVDPSTGVVTGVAAGSPTISYTLPTGCTRTYPIVVNPLPAVFSGPAQVCKGLSITLTETTTGGLWSSSSTTIATVGSTSSTTAVVSGKTAGVAGITYTLPTGCIMSLPVTVNPLPVPITAPTAGSCVTDANNPVITLFDGTSGGAWSSSNTSVATIVSFSGDLTSLIPGTTVITYTLPVTGCIITAPLTVNPIPAAITGTKVVCANAVTYLADPSFGGVWTSSSITNATVGSGTGIVTGVLGLSTPTISYTLPTGCVTLTTVTVNAAPGTVTGATNVCVGSTTNLVVGGGGTWASSNAGLASVTPGPVGGGVVTGVFAGNPLITYTLPVTGCFSTTAMTVNPVPAAITPAGARVCYGNTVTLNDATPSGVWSTSATVASVSSTGVVSTPVSVLTSTPAVIDYILGTGCKASNTVTVDPLPIPYTLSNGGITTYCAGGTGIDISLNVSTVGVNYQLYKDGVMFGSVAPGIGGLLDFGNMTAGGTYTAIATDATTGCVNNMAGSPVINVNPLPSIFTLSYVGSTPNYCDVPGAPGVDMCLSGSQPGWLYELFINGNPGPFIFGTGSSICFGPQTDGVYTVVATDPVTGCSANMTGTVTIGKFIIPLVHDVTVSDGGNYCSGGVGVHVGLDNANTGINYQLWLNGTTLVATKSGANSSLDFGLQTTAGTYTVVAVNAITGCTNNMNGSAVVTVLPLPAMHTVQVALGGSSSYCVGGIGVHMELNGSDGGINYTLLHGGVPVAGYVNIAGTGSTIDLGYQYMSGTYTVLATDAVTGCNSNMTGSVNVNIYPALTNYTVTVGGTGHFCATGSGLHIYMGTGSTVGVKYDLYGPTNTIVATKMGTGSTIDFGLFTTAGAYYVIATSTSGCSANMTGTPVIVVDALPTAYTMTADNSGAYCAGSAGVHIKLSFSDVGVSYQLYKGGVAVGSAMAGSSSSLDFGAFTATGTYTIVGTNNITGCQTTMTGSPVVSINPVPTGYTVTGGGSYCAGSTTGVALGLSNSQTGVDYQLYNNANPVGSPVSGTGTPLSFGFQTATGLYTVVAVDVTTSCVSNFSSSKVITIDPLPTVFNVTGGGSYCAGGTGFHVGLSNSTTGVDYTLYNGTAVKTLHGTSGVALDFGIQTAGGTYTVVANTVISGCSSNMNGSAVINANPLPTVYNIKGGGAYCAGDAGSHVYMSGSDAGVYYQLYNGGSAIGSPVLGTGILLDLGSQTIPGTYTAVAYNAATGCTQNMASSVNVSVNALPTAYTVTGGGSMCAGTSGFHVYLGGSQTGVSYQLMNGGVATGTAMLGTGAALDFGAQTAGGVYTVGAVNNATGCKNTMTGSGTIVIKPTPVAFTVTGTGSYCAGTNGVAIGVTGSEPGVNYQLYNSATAVGMPVGGTGTAITFGPQTKGIYTVQGMNMSSTCSNTMTGTATVTENPGVTPSVTVKGSDGTSCIGDVVNYTADPVNGGTPTYVWKVNGVTSGAGATFSTIPVMGSVISVVMTSDASCVTSPTATGSITMTTLPYVMPTATVSVDPGTSVCQGTPVSMMVSTTDAGTLLGTWMKNSIEVGTGSTYTYTPTSANDGDVIVYRIHSDYRCRMADTVFSDPVVMTVDAPAVPDFTIVSHLGPVIVGQVDTFIATVKNTKNATFSYQWYVEGTAVPGATMPIYINHDVYNDDKVSCEVTRLGACGNQSATQQTTVVLKNLGTKPVTTTIADISVLPNPNKGEFTVKGSIGTTNDESVSLEITNMLGQVVYTNKVMTHNGNINEHIKLSNTLANGMYILNLRSDVVNNVFHIVIEQ